MTDFEFEISKEEIEYGRGYVDGLNAGAAKYADADALMAEAANTIAELRNDRDEARRQLQQAQANVHGERSRYARRNGGGNKEIGIMVNECGNQEFNNVSAIVRSDGSVSIYRPMGGIHMVLYDTFDHPTNDKQRAEAADAHNANLIKEVEQWRIHVDHVEAERDTLRRKVAEVKTILAVGRNVGEDKEQAYQDAEEIIDFALNGNQVTP